VEINVCALLVNKEEEQVMRLWKKKIHGTHHLLFFPHIRHKNPRTEKQKSSFIVFGVHVEHMGEKTYGVHMFFLSSTDKKIESR